MPGNRKKHVCETTDSSNYTHTDIHSITQSLDQQLPLFKCMRMQIKTYHYTHALHWLTSNSWVLQTCCIVALTSKYYKPNWQSKLVSHGWVTVPSTMCACVEMYLEPPRSNTTPFTVKTRDTAKVISSLQSVNGYTIAVCKLCLGALTTNASYLLLRCLA